MSYVDGYVLPIKKNKLAAYKKLANLGRRTWMGCGALDYKECVGDDLNNKWGASFGKLAGAKPGETVVFAFVTYKSRAHRDSVNKKVMKKMENDGQSAEMPFDVKRMAYGGFKTFVGK